MHGHKNNSGTGLWKIVPLGLARKGWWPRSFFNTVINGPPVKKSNLKGGNVRKSWDKHGAFRAPLQQSS